MDKKTQGSLTAAMYRDAHDRLVAAALVAKEAAEAAEAGHLNLARGTALEAERLTQEAQEGFTAAAIIHRINPP